LSSLQTPAAKPLLLAAGGAFCTCRILKPSPTTSPLFSHAPRSVLCLLFHGYSLGRLVWDERPISFRSEDEEQLWRFFYRRCGMGRLEMKQV